MVRIHDRIGPYYYGQHKWEQLSPRRPRDPRAGQSEARELSREQLNGLAIRPANGVACTTHFKVVLRRCVPNSSGALP